MRRVRNFDESIDLYAQAIPLFKKTLGPKHAETVGATNNYAYALFESERFDEANGVLQDVHWSVGLFGYFPTYALGNIYAGQLFEKMKADLGSLDERISNGEMSDILRWLRQNVHRAGSLHAPDELMSKVVGEPVSSGPLLDYLEDKYLRLCESPS